MEPLYFSNFSLISGIPSWCTTDFKWVVKADLYEDRIIFRKASEKNGAEITLFNFQITKTNFYYEDEIKEKSKSVVGRSLVGGALLGPLGAVVGGVSGVPTKKVVSTKYFYTISYISSNNTEEIITLGTSCAFCNARKFDKELMKYITVEKVNDDNVFL